MKLKVKFKGRYLIPTRECNWRLHLQPPLTARLIGLSWGAGYDEIGGLMALSRLPAEPEEEAVIEVRGLIPLQRGGGALHISSRDMASAISRLGGEVEALGLWHTHGGLGVFWSQTDVRGIEEALRLGSPVVSLVASLPRVTARVDWREPRSWADLEVEVRLPEVFEVHRKEAEGVERMQERVYREEFRDMVMPLFLLEDDELEPEDEVYCPIPGRWTRAMDCWGCPLAEECAEVGDVR